MPKLAVTFALLLPAMGWAYDSAEAASVPTPGGVLARYTAGLAQSKTFDSGEVAVEIEASLPKLEKRGRLQAIRHFVPLGKSEYEVLQSEGDRTVRQQVIARYLTAKTQAEALPAASIAISPANYKFRYIGSIGAAPTLTYVFQIKPRKKGVGLIQGELWIDADSGLAVHQAGYLVKRPSVFLRRVHITQDTDMRAGLQYLRITRLDIETRLVGRAELTVRERPCAPALDLEAARFPLATSTLGLDRWDRIWKIQWTESRTEVNHGGNYRFDSEKQRLWDLVD